MRFSGAPDYHRLWATQQGPAHGKKRTTEDSQLNAEAFVMTASISQIERLPGSVLLKRFHSGERPPAHSYPSILAIPLIIREGRQNNRTNWLSRIRPLIVTVYANAFDFKRA